MQHDPTPLRDARMMRLDDYGFIAVEGARAVSLLQGQFTCDVRQAAATRVIEGACCTHKGRVIADFLLWAATPERILLRLRNDIVEATIAALSRYAALSRVTLRREPLVCIGILSDGSRTAGFEGFEDWPREPLVLVDGGMHQILQCDAGRQRFEIWSSSAALSELERRLAHSCTAASPDDWQLALIRDHRAEIVAATAGEFLPQMLDYDRGDMLSFRKGCYTGQEVIARARYKGAVKRRLHHLQGSCPSCPAPGTLLYRHGGDIAAGMVVNSAAAGTRIELLAVLATEPPLEPAAVLDTRDGGTFRLFQEPCAIFE